MERQLNDWIEGYMKVCENSEPPRMYHLWCAISVLAAVLQRKCRMDWGTLTFYPNMYTVLVGPSGACRKGTAMGIALSFLEDLEIKLAAESITREALIRELKNANVNSPDLMSGRPSVHSSLTIWAPELTVFLGYHNHQLLSDLTDWYDCRDRWTYRTKNMGTDEIIGVFVNILGATTPDLIRTTMPLDAIGGGLTSRMIFVFEEKKEKIVPMPFLTEAELGLKHQLSIDLESINGLNGRFQATEDFLAGWTEWYTNTASSPPFKDPRFSGYIERRPNHVMKLSMIVNAARTDNMIVEQRDLNRAVSILEDTERKMTNTFSGVGKYLHADTLTKVMNEVGIRPEGMTKEELTELFRNDANADTMKEIMNTLSTMGWLDTKLKDGVEIYRRKLPGGE